jgi:chromate transporter
MDKNNPLVILLTSFAPLSLLTIGGGASIIADVQRICVENGWYTPQEFIQIFGLSRAAPGPATLIVTLIGWHVSGITGALVASIAIVLPSSLLTFAVARAWHRGHTALWRRAVAKGLAPIAAGLILSSTVLLLKDASGRSVAWIVAGLVSAISFHTRIGSIALLGIGTVAFAILMSA